MPNTMTITPQPNQHQKLSLRGWGEWVPLASLMLLAAALLLAGRVFLGVGWGAGVRPRADGNAAYGIAFNALDNLSYVAWAQQARLGRLAFTNLYTTEPHRALMFNPFFLLAGAAARLTGWNPIFILNLLGFAAVPLTVAFLYLAARAMGMTRRGALLAGWLTLLGSGLTWLAILIRVKLGLAAPLGADFCGVVGYYDLIPATAFLVYPYHAVGFGLAAGVLWCVAAAERCAVQGRPMRRWLAATFFTAAALAGTRPYEPAALGVCTLVYALVGRLWRAPNAAARWRILAALAAGAGPFLLYAAWLTRQPVWADFSTQLLTLSRGRLYWLAGFGMFWPLALAGAWGARRSAGLRLGLPALWVGFLFFILVVLDARQNKLAAGGFLALALLAGQAWDRIFARLGRLTPARRAAWGALAAGVLFSMSGTLYFVIPFFTKVTPTLSPELLAVVQTLRPRLGEKIPTVLTDTARGAVLPGLAGVRVYAGHEAFTLNSEAKARELAAAGLQRGEEGSGAVNAPTPAALDHLLAEAPFDYVLAGADTPAAALLARHPRLRPLFAGRQLRLFAVRPASE